MTLLSPPLRPATPIDVELAKPHPEEMTEIERRKREREEDSASDERGKPSQRERAEAAEVPKD
jgi:hypothetical protein